MPAIPLMLEKDGCAQFEPPVTVLPVEKLLAEHCVGVTLRLRMVAVMLPVPAAVSAPVLLMVTPFEVPLAKNEATPAVDVPTVLTWNNGSVPVLPVVSLNINGFVVAVPAVT